MRLVEVRASDRDSLGPMWGGVGGVMRVVEARASDRDSLGPQCVGVGEP